MNFTTISAILRGDWLLNEQWASAHLPIVARLLKGDSPDFGIKKINDELSLIPNFGHVGAGSTKIYSVRPYSNLSSIEFGSIAVVTLAGPMLKNGDDCSYGMVDHASLINRLADATNIGGIIIDLDSPGGQVDGTAMLAGAIKDAGTRKPVISFINDGMAASAGMWIASAAMEIYASQPTDEFGSIGVYTTLADWASYYESMGLKTRDIYAPQSTDKNKGYYDAIGGDDTLIKEGLSVLANQFINTISANRAGKIKGDSWKTGKMFFAGDAKKIGLIDGIKSFNQVVARMTSLISQKQQSNNSTMAFEKALVAAKAESFAVTDEGFVLTEENLNNMESALASLETAAETATALTTANSTIEGLNTKITSLNNEISASAETISANATRIQELESEVEALGKKPSGKGSKLNVKADETTETAAVPSYLDDNNPANQYADKHVRTKK